MADPRCICCCDETDDACPIHGNHPSNIEPREEGEEPYRRWSEDDE